MFHNRLMCDVKSLSVDFNNQCASIHTTGGCVDMAGAIALVNDIDPDIDVIETFIDNREDTRYVKGRDRWYAQTGWVR